MPTHATYILRIWCSTALSDQHWVAHLESVASGELLRFRDPDTLLLHLRSAVQGSVTPPASLRGDAATDAEAQAPP